MQRHRRLEAIFLAIISSLGLVACGNQQAQPKRHVRKTKTVQMNDSNITGGDTQDDHAIVVHNTDQLRSVLHKDGSHPKDILINSNLNGSTDGYLQDKIQLSENKTASEIQQLGQKPKLGFNPNEVSGGPNKKQRQMAIKKNKQKWQLQQKMQKQLKQNYKKQQQAFHNLVEQKTSDTKVKIPSNTTISEDPNTQLQNITFVTGGKNIIFRNLNMKAPVNYTRQHQNVGQIRNNAILVRDSNGVLLTHDTFTDADNVYHANKTPKQNKKNKQANTNKKQKISYNYLTNVMENAKHVVIANSRYTNSNKAIKIGDPEKQVGNNNVTLDNNLFDDVAQSSPEVSYSKVKMNHNYFINDNQKQNKYQTVIDFGNKAKIKSNHDTVNVLHCNSNQAVKKAVRQFKTWHGKSLKAVNIIINNQHYRLVNKNGNMKIFRVQSTTQAPNIDSYDNDGAILGRTRALE